MLRLVGVKVTVKVVVPATATGEVTWAVTVKSPACAPPMATFATVNGAPPVFVTVNVCAADWFKATSPKSLPLS